MRYINLLCGNFREYTEAGQALLWDHCTEIYGSIFNFSVFSNMNPLFSAFNFRIGHDSTI